MYIYADNAGTTKMSPVAIDAMTKCMNEVFGNPSSLHSTGQRAAEVLQKAREDVAEALGADFNEIYFTSGGSEADNQAIRSAALFGAKKGKKHLISTKIEHHAVLHTLKKLEKEGLVIGQWDDPKKKFQKFYSLTPLGEKEFDNRKSLLKHKIEESLMVFQIVYKDLYL